jgi:uncharacterized protein
LAGSNTISGYGVVFESRSQDLGSFCEVVDARAMAKSAGDGWPNVTCKFNHDENLLLGSIQAKTLRLQVDARGVSYECDLPSSRDDVLELTSRGELRSSFGFRCFDDSWSYTDGGVALRRLLSVQLLDIGPVVSAAYLSSTATAGSAGLRSLARWADAPIADVENYAARGELRSFFTVTGRSRSSRPLTPRQKLLVTMGRRWTPQEHPQQPSVRQRQVELLGKRWGPGDW